MFHLRRNRCALERVASGEDATLDGWLAYGAALNEGRALFPGDREFGQWKTEFVHPQLGEAPKWDDEAAAMWAAANPEDFAAAREAGGARTVRGIHARWSEMDAERVAAEARIRARAIRRAGELLRQIEPRPGARTDIEPDAAADTRSDAAREAGMSKRQQNTATRIANVPEADFEAQVESDRPPTLSQLAQQGIKRWTMPGSSLSALRNSRASWISSRRRPRSAAVVVLCLSTPLSQPRFATSPRSCAASYSSASRISARARIAMACADPD